MNSKFLFIVFEHMAKIGENLKGEVGGSYRRGRQDSGDIDIVITNTEGKVPM